jgi:malate dehydrogenase (oxaloacetate-decarboxylating)(NADP+)
LSTAIAVTDNISIEEARKNIWLVDSKGLVTSTRTDKLANHKLPYVQTLNNPPQDTSLLAAIKKVQPSAIFGVSAISGAFDEAVCKELALINDVPLIFALSNPTSKSECTAAQAYEWTNGKCGTPFLVMLMDVSYLVMILMHVFSICLWISF